MQQTLFLGAICAFAGVAFGAFGAHGLKAIISPEMLTVYQTGVTYQMWHALGLILVALLQQSSPTAQLLSWAARLMFIGILLFSGSLYALAILDIKALGIITPFGGVCFLIAWLLVMVYAVKKKTHNRYS